MDIMQTLQVAGIGLFFKVALLILILLFNVFVIIIHNHIRSLKRIVVITNAAGANVIQILGLIYLIASLSLFFLSLVIL